MARRKENRMIDYIVTILAIIGAVLNIKKLRAGFILWSFTNSFWVIHNLYIAEYAQAILYAVFVVISVAGWFSWKKGIKV